MVIINAGNLRNSRSAGQQPVFVKGVDTLVTVKCIEWREHITYTKTLEQIHSQQRGRPQSQYFGRPQKLLFLSAVKVRRSEVEAKGQKLCSV